MRQSNLKDPAIGDGPSMSIPVGPVAPEGRLPTLPLLAAVTVVVGTIAFLAGLQIGGGSNSETIQVASPNARPTDLATQRAAPSPAVVVPGQSEFARIFQPLELIAGIPDAARCVGGSAGQQLDSNYPTQTFVSAWMTFCPVSAAHREAFIEKVFGELGRVTPAQSSMTTSNEQGRFIGLIPYQQIAFVGSVTMAAVVRGTGLEISITLEERAGP